MLTLSRKVEECKPLGTGKTLNVMDKLSNHMPEQFVSVFMTFSARTSVWINRPTSVHRFLHRALSLCPQLCMGIQPGARFPAQSTDALSATMYGHSTEAID
jgi:hypothetical protein